MFSGKYHHLRLACSLLFLSFALSFLLFLGVGCWVRNADVVQRTEFGTLEAEGTLFYFLQILQTGKRPLMLRAKLTLQNRIRQIKVSLGLLIALQEKHAAAEVVVNCCGVNCVATECLLSNLFCLEVEAEGEGGLLHVVGY